MHANSNFYAGLCAALAVVTSADQETVWVEIVNTCIHKELAQYARKQCWRWAGFAKYYRRNFLAAQL